jgi:putative membrane protein
VTAPSSDLPRRRLHPLSPVLRGVRLFALAVAALSFRTAEQLWFWRFAALVAALFVLMLIYAFISWRFTGYEVVGRELRIHEGLLSRRVRTVPLERLQSIEVIQPFQARPFGLAELKLDLAGSQRSEAPLSFLPLAEARALRAQLLSLAAGNAARQSTDAEEEEAEEPLWRVRNKDVALSQFLTPPVMFTPIAVLYVVGQLVFNQQFGFFSVASMVSAVFATVFAPLMRMSNFWNFRLARNEDGKLRVRHGLLTTRSQTVPIRRIQSLTVTWPWLWRGKGWLRVTLAVAGQSSAGGESQKAETDRLLPVATLDTARSIVPLAMPGVDVGDMPFTRVPRAARWIAPLRHKVLAAGLTDRVFGSVDGVLTRTMTVVPYERIQSVRLTQGPLQRRLGLASVHADIAGGSPVTAPHRPLTQAYTWATDLAARSQAARTALANTPPTLPTPPLTASATGSPSTALPTDPLSGAPLFAGSPSTPPSGAPLPTTPSPAELPKSAPSAESPTGSDSPPATTGPESPAPESQTP